ncbi:phosphoribosylglycinamide formyltransferase [Methanohalophilus portucalensis]|uniref:phosphoribosylglycinamide formyltransferase 1 n=2 Tax=Methanohalophilus portucalensis TaxID=39664 RepID=A0A1L9C2F3_9EURY|nr:phosphoribosylglycinamide formyltransferase [Methanohalophilus portucalensis]ATU07321.1 phosphoribosylglycinamide formyltransferase [Methanohalophilus portucalensis]OJH48636.1 formyltetrahydrofolate-dependent phosphoribosylglycinamide formyltransferase [Methanohalophilus portucalensis FDF-1]RNI09533.1 phosphoribosylglycinamide formyltransferase [Methanohalophilus portucalensis FDF-1]SMH40120.1 formyltetrahydrofolate-dependent phosphoribosylglycinamide formyltransferase [Methanohalophilus por
MTLNIAVLISGRGSNLQSIIDNVENGYIPNACVSVVISDKKDAYGLERAMDHGINAVFIDPAAYQSKEKFETALLDVLARFSTDVLLLAGFMRILGSNVIKAYSNRIMNIHPALLPSFKGLHAQKQALDYGVKIAGCTVHFVDEGMDSGPIILQKSVPVLDSDTEESLSERILAQEHIIFPEAVKLFAEGRLDIKGRRVHIS